MTANEHPARDRLGCHGVAERPVVVTKPGNAGGAKEPQFKDNAGSDKGSGYWRQPTTRPSPSVAERVARDREECLVTPSHSCA